MKLCADKKKLKKLNKKILEVNRIEEAYAVISL